MYSIFDYLYRIITLNTIIYQIKYVIVVTLTHIEYPWVLYA